MKRKELIGKKNIVIFGAGVNGIWTYEQLKKEGYTVSAFIDDSHFEAVDGIEVINLEQFSKSSLCSENTMVVIAFFIKNTLSEQRIKGRLTKCGIPEKNICNYIELLPDYYFDKKAITDEQSEIRAAYELLKEPESRKIFESYLKAIVEENVGLFVAPTEKEQYFDSDIFRDLSKKEGFFVDCGAYIGDTFMALVTQNIQMKYMGFEPNMNNYCLLADTVTKYDKMRTIVIPCATSDKNKNVLFSYDDEKSDSPGSAISNDGNMKVPAIALDSVIGGIDVALLKMDIEGAEEDSIVGAKHVIKNEHPDLAICVYHKTTDMWRLINLINSYYPYYNFYMRSYYLYGRETVLYAVNDN